MKVTLSAAMRARDVSRPAGEDLAAAAAVENAVPERVQREATSPAGATPPKNEQRAARQPRQRRRSRERREHS